MRISKTEQEIMEFFWGKTGKPDICGNAGVLEPGEKEELVKTDTKYVS